MIDTLNHRCEVQMKDSTSGYRNAVLRWDREADACGVSPSPLAAPYLHVRSLHLHSQRTAEGVFQTLDFGDVEMGLVNSPRKRNLGRFVDT